MMSEQLPSWHREVIELHEFFEALFLGTINSLDRAELALAPSFTMAGPHGNVSDRATVMSQLDTARAHARDLRITIPHAQLIVETDDLVVAEYIEAHDLSVGHRHERRTTVIFGRDAEGPNGLRWLRAHETWIEPTPAGG